MHPDAVLWVVVPLVYALAALIATLGMSIRRGSVLQWTLSAIALPSALFAIRLFVAMLLGAWPTYWAHLLTGVAGVAVLAQWALLPKRTGDERTS
jgi:hypothetical protein